MKLLKQFLYKLKLIFFKPKVKKITFPNGSEIVFDNSERLREEMNKVPEYYIREKGLH